MDEFLLIEGFLEDDDFNRNHALYGIIREVGDHHNLIGAARSIPVYNKNYFEEIVPRYSINDFKSHFRMSRVAFQKLCESIAPLQRRRHLFISLEKKVSFFIWIIAKQESFLATSDRFGFGKGTGYYIFKTILQSVTQLKEDFIKWPTATERSDIATRIEIKCVMKGEIISCAHKDIYFLETNTKSESTDLANLFASPAGREMVKYKPRTKLKHKLNPALEFFVHNKSKKTVGQDNKSTNQQDTNNVKCGKSSTGSVCAETQSSKSSRRSSIDLYEEAASILGLTCAQTDDCKCIECQCHYFDFEDDLDFSTNGEYVVDHTSTCTIQ